MSYLPELHSCCVCRVDLGAENGDGICPSCEPNEDCKTCGGEGVVYEDARDPFNPMIIMEAVWVLKCPDCWKQMAEPKCKACNDEGVIPVLHGSRGHEVQVGVIGCRECNEDLDELKDKDIRETIEAMHKVAGKMRKERLGD